MNSLTEGNLSVPVETITQTIAAARVESSLPLAYRLIRRNDGNGGKIMSCKDYSLGIRDANREGNGATLKLRLNPTTEMRFLFLA